MKTRQQITKKKQKNKKKIYIYIWAFSSFAGQILVNPQDLNLKCQFFFPISRHECILCVCIHWDQYAYIDIYSMWIMYDGCRISKRRITAKKTQEK